MVQNDKAAAHAAFLSRVAPGAMALAHGVVLKYFTYSLAGTAKSFDSVGLRGWGYPLYLSLLSIVQAIIGAGAFAPAAFSAGGVRHETLPEVRS